jgi:hypothetical protein
VAESPGGRWRCAGSGPSPLMLLSMMGRAQPDHFQWLRVVRMMSLGWLSPTDSTGLPQQHSFADSPSNSITRPHSLRILLTILPIGVEVPLWVPHPVATVGFPVARLCLQAIFLIIRSLLFTHRVQVFSDTPVVARQGHRPGALHIRRVPLPGPSRGPALRAHTTGTRRLTPH